MKNVKLPNFYSALLLCVISCSSKKTVNSIKNLQTDPIEKITIYNMGTAGGYILYKLELDFKDTSFNLEGHNLYEGAKAKGKFSIKCSDADFRNCFTRLVDSNKAHIDTSGVIQFGPRIKFDFETKKFKFHEDIGSPGDPSLQFRDFIKTNVELAGPLPYVEL